MGLAIHLDAVGGVAGDMFVAALLSARPDLAPRVFDDCAGVLPEGLAPQLVEGTSGALAVHRFALSGTAPKDAATYTALAQRIEDAPLHPETARHAGAILRRLAEAEAAVHAVPLERVHFHEIADWDSLMDVVAAGSIAAALEGAAFTVSTLPLGGGLVRTRHGMLPVPAPATARLLAGFALADDGVSGERVTPTGAAILAHLARSGAPSPGRLVATGLGAGTRELPDRPNVLRALVFETAPAADGLSRERVAVLAFEVDDMTGEEIALAAERLRAEPMVLDVSLAARSGKKGRPATSFRVLAHEGAAEEIAALCLEETATIGLRMHVAERRTLSRESGEAAGLRVKRVVRPSGAVTVKAEADDLAGTETLGARRARTRLAETNRS